MRWDKEARGEGGKAEERQRVMGKVHAARVRPHWGEGGSRRGALVTGDRHALAWIAISQVTARPVELLNPISKA
jgi:hypothetical protein